MPRFEAHCGKKVQYQTEEIAKRAARDQFRKKGRLLDVYQCRYCECWHTGGPSRITPLDTIRGIGLRKDL